VNVLPSFYDKFILVVKIKFNCKFKIGVQKEPLILSVNILNKYIYKVSVNFFVYLVFKRREIFKRGITICTISKVFCLILMAQMRCNLFFCVLNTIEIYV